MSKRPDQELLQALARCEHVLLTGPIEPDGDSVGACLALQRLLDRRGIRADVGGVPAYRYVWMPGAEHFVPDSHLEPRYDAVVVLDGDRHRLTDPARAAFDAAPVKAIVDHHASTRDDGYTHTWIARGATSTCEMIYDLLRDEGEPLDREMAELLYVGAIFDTGGFRYSNTTPATHRMAARLLEEGIDHATIAARILMDRRIEALRAAGHLYSSAEIHLDGALSVGILSLATSDALGLVPGDLEGIVDTLVHVEGVEVAVLLVQKSGGRVKASLRSRGRVDVAAVAQELTPSGGGHTKAAGAMLRATLGEARDRVVAVVAPKLEQPRAAAP